MGVNVAERNYHIYGRKTHSEPLAYLGWLEIEAVAGLREKALEQFGASGWVELVAFPEESIIRVISGNPR